MHIHKASDQRWISLKVDQSSSFGAGSQVVRCPAGLTVHQDPKIFSLISVMDLRRDLIRGCPDPASLPPASLPAESI